MVDHSLSIFKYLYGKTTEILRLILVLFAEI